ncbi:hypothetical protein KSP39_PZI002868 [Platanthera zijinensis]|uniref:Uncharacterized protein n=1 Tax=Platanthera zijinensis TaxID=2320716 RepID=A0AAP0GEP9_9ASPA
MTKVPPRRPDDGGGRWRRRLLAHGTIACGLPRGRTRAQGPRVSECALACRAFSRVSRACAWASCTHVCFLSCGCLAFYDLVRENLGRTLNQSLTTSSFLSLNSFDNFLACVLSVLNLLQSLWRHFSLA